MPLHQLLAVNDVISHSLKLKLASSTRRHTLDQLAQLRARELKAVQRAVRVQRGGRVELVKGSGKDDGDWVEQLDDSWGDEGEHEETRER